MVIIIANKLKDVIDSSKVMDMDYKCATGYFSSSDCIRTLQSVEMEHLIIDVTALKDVYEITCWKQFQKFFNPKKTVVLLDSSKSDNNIGFLSMLITMGFYNFAKTKEEMVRLLTRPNAYQDVARFQKASFMEETRKEEDRKKMGEYFLKVNENKEQMQDYVKKMQDGSIQTVKKENPLKLQLLVGFLILPILTILSTLVFYFIEVWISDSVSEDSSIGEYLYSNLAHTDFTPFVLIGILISAFIFAIYYTSLNAKIKRMQMTRGKFIVIPFAIYTTIVLGEYYLFGVLGSFYKAMIWIPLDDKPYVYQDFYMFSVWVAIAVMVIYYAGIVVNNSKTLKFEVDLEQKLTIVEKFWVMIFTIMISMPVLCQILNIFKEYEAMAGYAKTCSSIYEDSRFRVIITILEVALTGVIIYQSQTRKEFDYVELKSEDVQNFLASEE